MWITETPIAHRGLHDINLGIPENSMYAFEVAISQKYIIELDVHLLKDGNVVVFHDDDTLRMTGKNKPIIAICINIDMR